MIGKVLAVLALVMLPMSVALWHRSHSRPVQYRFDVSDYKSMWVYLRNGVCGLQLLSMPTSTSLRSEFRNPLLFDMTPTQGSFFLTSFRHGPNRTTWLVFPFWLSTAFLVVVGALPIYRGPIRRQWRRWRGCCITCGYNLTGNRSGRCPECGDRIS